MWSSRPRLWAAPPLWRVGLSTGFLLVSLPGWGWSGDPGCLAKLILITSEGIISMVQPGGHKMAKTKAPLGRLRLLHCRPDLCSYFKGQIQTGHRSQHECPRFTASSSCHMAEGSPQGQTSYSLGITEIDTYYNFGRIWTNLLQLRTPIRDMQTHALSKPMLVIW